VLVSLLSGSCRLFPVVSGPRAELVRIPARVTVCVLPVQAGGKVALPVGFQNSAISPDLGF
jgi:hypothetical protein